MLNKKIDNISFLINGIFFVLIGILLLTVPQTFMKYLMLIIGYGMLFLASLNILFFFIKRSRNYNSLAKICLNFILGIIVIFFNTYLIMSMPILFGLYLLLHSLIHFINYLIYRKDKIKGRLKILIQFYTTLIFALILIFIPGENVTLFEIISGIYFIILGLNYFSDFIFSIMPTSISNKFKKHIKITLPTFITASIPSRLIKLINETLEVENNTSLKINENKKPDLEVLVHLAENGSAKFGHVEICFENLTYSYGNYDNHSRQLFDSIGDGVILIADRDKYIKYAVTNKERYIVSFGLKLNSKQIEKVRKRINTLINENTIDWYPDLQKAELGLIAMDDFKDMSSDLYKYADGKYKKIIKGKNKRFFVLKNNCAMVAESILEKTGTSILEMNELICPGTYYDYLNREFLRKKSNVITRNVYTKYDYIEK